MPYQCYYPLDVQIRASSGPVSAGRLWAKRFLRRHTGAVRRLTAALEGARGISNLHPAFASVLVEFDPRLHSHAEIERPGTVVVGCAGGGIASFPAGGDSGALRRRGRPRSRRRGAPSRSHAAPRVELHSSAEYVVSFVGFSTCFPYLAGLPAELATPRLAAPRRHVAAGSVAIAGSQAGVYPLASPGMAGDRPHGAPSFRSGPGEPPPLLRMGDQVRFVPIEEGEC